MFEAFCLAFSYTLGIMAGLSVGSIPLMYINLWWDKKKMHLKEVERILKERRQSSFKMPDVRGN